MASPVGNMVIKVDLDGAGFNKGVQGLQRQMRQVTSEMKANLSGFDKTDRSVDKLSKTYDGLAKKYQVQEKLVEEQKKKYDQLAEAKGENNAKTQAAASAYNNEIAKMNEMESEMSSLKSEMTALNAEAEKLESPWTRMSAGMNEFGDKLQGIGTGMKDIGKKMSAMVTLPIVGAFTASTKAAVDWESSFAGVRKTVDTSEAGYQKLADGIRDMTKELSVSANEIAAVAESAGQLGIEEDNILSFSRTIIDLGEATNMTTEQASNSFARFANIMGMSQSEFSNFGSSIVELGNNMATTESEIMDMSMRLAGTGNQIGLTESEIAALAATMSSVGIESEAGGSAMSAVMKKMQNAVSSGGVELENFAGAAKMSTTDFAEAFNNDPMGALINLVKGLEESGASGENLNGILETLGVKGIRESDALLRLAGNSELLSDAVDMSSSAFTENTALTDEAAQRYETLAAKFELFKNRIVEMGIQIGEVLAPHIEKLLTWATGLMDKFTGLDDRTKMIGIAIAGVAAAIGPLLAVGGTMLIWAGSLVKTFAPIVARFREASGILGILKIAFGALISPVGITIGVIAGLGAAFAIAYTKSETFRGIVQNLITRFREFIPTIVSFGQTIYSNFMTLVVPAVQAVKTFFLDMFAKVKQFWQSDGQTVIQAITNGVNFVKTIVSAVMPVVTAIIGTAFKLALAVVKMVWENIKGVINGGLNIIMGLVRVFSGIFTGDFSKMWQGVKQIFSGAIQLVWNGFQLLFYGRLLKGVGSLVKLFSGSIRSLWTTVVNFFKNMFTGAVGQATSLFNRVISIGISLNSGFNNIVSGMVRSVINFFKNMFTNVTTTVGNIRSGVQNTFSAMKDFAVNSVVRLKDGAVNGFNTLKDRATILVLELKDKALGYFDDMVGGAKALPGKLGDAIKNGASKAVDGIKSLGNKMTSKLGEVVNGVIGGLNSITAKIGIDTKVEKWDVPTFSTGTGQGSPSGKLTKNGKIAMDTLATVGDKGKGNGKGTRELVRYPNGKVGLYDNDATIFAPKGTTIFSNKETESMLGQIPKFSEGTGLWGSIKELAGKAVDYITNPKKIFDDLIALVGDSFGDMSGFAGNFIKGAWSMIKDGMFGWIKGKFSEASVGKSQKWMDYKMTTPYSPNAPVPGYPTAFNKGHHYGIDYGTPNGVNITAPMAGTVTKMSDRGGGNVARLKAGGNAAQYFMHMSSVKTGKVGIGDSVGKSGNSGEWTTGPHVHWQHEDPSASYVQNRNTKNPLSTIKGHLKGGQILSDGLFNLHKGEYVINPNEPTEAMKLLAIVGKKLAGKSKQTKELPNVPGNNGSERLSNVEDKLDKMIRLMELILAKDTDVKLNVRSVKEEMDNIDYDDDMIQRLLKGRKKGVPAT